MFHNMLWFWPSELRGTGLGFGLGMRSTSDTANVANVAAATAGLSQLLRHYKRCQRHHNQLFARLNLFLYSTSPERADTSEKLPTFHCRLFAVKSEFILAMHSICQFSADYCKVFWCKVETTRLEM